VIDALGQSANFVFQRLDGAARHRLGQQLADFGNFAAQRRERVFVGLMQR